MKKNVAFIPVRGGSKSIPLKNIKIINGMPLIYWTLKAACECSDIDTVYVSTDYEEIKKCTLVLFDRIPLSNKIRILDRSIETATDFASTESAMLEFSSQHEFENIVLIQATSPLLVASDLHNGFKAFSEEHTDSVLSVVKQKRFIWTENNNGFASPENYDCYNRPRRQDFDGYLVENGAFYITSKDRLIKYKNRISGNIKAVEMCSDSYFEIDEVDDWFIVSELLAKRDKTPYIPSIKMLITDCDGCLTDGGMYYSEFGDELKKFNTKDGMAFSLLQSHGILVGVITGENVKLNRNRAEKLNLDIYVDGCSDKLSVINKLCKQFDVSLSEICYIGDDINDLLVLKSVGFSCAPRDAVDVVKANVMYTTKSNGGEGVIREVADLIIDNIHDERKK